MAKLKVGAVLLAFSALILLSVQAIRGFEHKAGSSSIVPFPAQINVLEGMFRLQSTTFILVDPFSESTGALLAERLRRATGYDFPLRRWAEGVNQSGAITLTAQDSDTRLGPEGYEVAVTPDQIAIRAPGSAGLFYGTQSLLELLPPQIFSKEKLPGRNWNIPCARIRDRPRFRWRGLMLDVSRHFFPPSEIKQLLDVMALHKLNVFHWHLTDDQGWRIEIKKYPRLTEIGAWRKGIGFNLDPKSSTSYDSQGRYGGYYTQADVRDLIAYAQARFITILPEIELPGHASAALAAYPEFSCSGGPYTTDMSEAVCSGVFCAGKEDTFEFLQNILIEVMNLFPGQLIHTGGDEVSRVNWRNCPLCRGRVAREGLEDDSELQRYFIKRIEQFVNAHGKRLIGWSEIWNNKLARSTALMDWIGGGVDAVQAGHDAVMSPEEFCYLDFYQSKNRSTEPPAAGAYLPLDKVYGFEPILANISPQEQAHILGAQANVWTEYMPSFAHVEYMVFPRLSALAEVVWSPRTSRKWPDFTRRLLVQEQRLDQLGVKYRPSQSHR
jgi:hexosaminidase